MGGGLTACLGGSEYSEHSESVVGADGDIGRYGTIDADAMYRVLQIVPSLALLMRAQNIASASN